MTHSKGLIFRAWPPNSAISKGHSAAISKGHSAARKESIADAGMLIKGRSCRNLPEKIGDVLTEEQYREVKELGILVDKDDQVG